MLNKFGNNPLGIKESGIWDDTLNTSNYSGAGGQTYQNFNTDYATNLANNPFNQTSWIESTWTNFQNWRRNLINSTTDSTNSTTNSTNSTTNSTGKGVDVPAAGKKETGNKIMQGAGTAMNGIGQLAWNSSNNKAANFGTGQTAYDTRTGISDAMVNSGNPYVAAAGLATKVVDGIVDIAGGRAANYSKSDLSDIGLGDDGSLNAARIANNAMNFLPGSALLFGNVSGKKLSNIGISQDTENVASSFSGTMNQINSAKKLGGTSMAWYFGSANQKMENKIQELQQKANTMGQISRANTLRINNNYGQELASQNASRYSGSSASNLAVGRKGLQLPDKAAIAIILEARSKKTSKEAPETSEKIPGVDTNIIPEGALHAHKNHLEEANPEMDKVTEKGIPVIATDEKGNYVQLAEIERDELIYTKEATDKVEGWLKEWKDADIDKKRELELICGKYITNEIVNNTIDANENKK